MYIKKTILNLYIIPNQMQDDEQYQAFHIREADEEVPDGDEPIQVYEVGPGEYRAVVDIINHRG